ncbi:hypothetical protein [uncultured Bartonella sp.]|uniref:hypothetical protein n=1 Tax=uncultured Bartonella sp. TaxID=104108 RepID=UPI0026010C54|nr:hypothetical protein [uncultured Bartonella sp.]
MTREAVSDEKFKCLKQQNIILILLATALCFVLSVAYCLLKPEVYVATVEFSVHKADGTAIDDSTRNKITSLLLSRSAAQPKDDPTGGKRNDTKFELFGHSFSVKECFDHIELSFSDKNPTYTQSVLQRYFDSFRNDLLKAFPDKTQNRIAAIREKRNNLLKSAFADFDQSFKSSNRQEANSELYASLLNAINNRISLTASIEVLNDLKRYNQSPLELEFIANDPAVLRTTSELNKLNTDIAHMENRLGSAHPQIKAMKAEQSELKDELDNNINLAVKRLYTEAELATRIESSLRGELKSAGEAGLKPDHKIFEKFEKQLKSIWDDYDKTIEASGLMSGQALVVNSSPIRIEKLAFFSRFAMPISVFTILVFLLLSIIMLFVRKRAKIAVHNRTTQENPEVLEKNIPISTKQDQSPEYNHLEPQELVERLLEIDAQIVSIVGDDAAQSAARLSMGLKKNAASILLVDVSTNEIGNLIGPHRGFTDVLTGDADVSDVIYNDYDTGVDILPQGIASMLRAKDFASDIPTMLKGLKEKYSFILIAMSEVPEFGVEELFGQSDCLVVSSDEIKDQENWSNLFSEYSVLPVFTLIDS